ncbi:hypothetical protein B0H67DRAFT_483872 [Lasiosphaeris hirsuta]|uniref:Sulfate transporter n=1 Tax=Lasiosphaeris hirsuta TaxID=260670 RepID=A0AA40ARG7_9PEZI|nr:hypothetical protein B0H67DRAFT_483872 [Lasiosphaeris hirsuta]
MALSDLGAVNRRNLAMLRRSPTAEISGALGDLGTLLPLMIALALKGCIDLPATLVMTGLFNIATGAVFGIPLPVQPMKAIAAASIARSSVEMGGTLFAGTLVSLAVLVLSLTGLVRRLNQHTPTAIIKGIQLGAGLQLVLSAGTSLLLGLDWTSPALDNRLWALLTFTLLLLAQRLRGPRFPFALLVFTAGLGLAVLSILFPHRRGNHAPHLPRLAPWQPRFYLPLPEWSGVDTAIGMAVAQLPLTLLNSIVAVSALAADLFPSEGELTPSVTTIGLSVAAMNLVGCWFGAMPVCHGAGGLAAQHRFGARSGAAVIILGLAKVALGVLFGSTLVDLFDAFPRGMLGVMLAAAGVELARAGVFLSGNQGEEGWTILLMTAAGTLALKDVGAGFAVGMMVYGVYRLGDYLERRGVGERRPLLR